MSLIKNMKDRFQKLFHEAEKYMEKHPDKEANSDVKEEKGDIGKKVFERTGQLREGVAQSSTKVQRQNVVPQDFSIKKHGVRNKERLFKEKEEAKRDRKNEV